VFAEEHMHSYKSFGVYSCNDNKLDDTSQLIYHTNHKALSCCGLVLPTVNYGMEDYSK